MWTYEQLDDVLLQLRKDNLSMLSLHKITYDEYVRVYTYIQELRLDNIVDEAIRDVTSGSK